MNIVFEFTDTYSSDAPSKQKRPNTFGVLYPTQDILLDIEVVAEVQTGDPVFDIDPLSGISLLQSVKAGYEGEESLQSLMGEGSLYYCDTIFANRETKTPNIELDVIPITVTASATYYQAVTIREIGLIPEHGKKGNVYIELGSDTNICSTVANLLITSVKVTGYAIPYDMEYYRIAKAQNKLYRMRTSEPIQSTINGTLVKQADVLEEGSELIGWIMDGYNATTVALSRTQLKDGDREMMDIDYHGYETRHNLNSNHLADPDTFINVQIVLLENPYRINSKSDIYVSSASDTYQMTFLYREPVT